jgi:glycosyltransferase involved in cell wall biosynthesis
MSLRIVVCTGQIPFERGGSEILAEALVEQLRQRGHAVEMVRIPCYWGEGGELLKSFLAWRLVNLTASEGKSIDRLVALKFPAYVAAHPTKVTWLVQQFRQAYDLYGTPYSPLGNTPQDVELREAIWRMDTRTIGESKHVFTISDNVGKRLKQYNGLSSETLYPPPALEGRFHHEGYGDYVFSLSRLNVLKRVDLLVRAMGLVKTPLRCRIAGRGEELAALQALAQEVHAAERITFLGYVSDEDALAHYAGALAIYYAPLDEDYGLATVEGMKSRKPVLTARDSGGVLEFVQHRQTGMVVAPDDPAELARCLDELYEDRALVERLGQAAAQRVAGITWEATIARLLEA